MTPPRLRGLGARRLSNRTDESTSIERQGEQIEGHSKLHDIDLVAITEDVDVSGAISPFDRKDLGPWLTDPDKIAQWDVIIVAKLERLTRSLVHFHELIEWLDRNGKTLISVAESLDLSTPVGRMFANLLAMFAQFQRERTAELRKEAYDKLKANGWWNGGRYKYGYRPVKVDTHWELEIDQDNADIINWIAERILAGHSRMGVGRMLEERGVPAPFGGTTWGRDTVARVLIRSQELIDEENRYKVLDALDSTKHTYTRRGDATMLLNVGFCGHCKKPLYAKRNVQKGKYLYKHYYCPGKCGARFIKMPDLDQKVSDAFLDSYGNVPTVDKSVTQGRSHLKEIMAIEQQIRDLDLDDPDYDAKNSELRHQRAMLKDAPKDADKSEVTFTGKTVSDYWPALDKPARRMFLLQNRIKVYAIREPDGYISVVIGPDADTLEGNEYFTTIYQLGGPDFPAAYTAAAEAMQAEVAELERQHGFRINPDGSRTPLTPEAL